MLSSKAVFLINIVALFLLVATLIMQLLEASYYFGSVTALFQ